MTPLGEDPTLRATGRLARTWRGLAAAARQRAGTRAAQRSPGEREGSIEGDEGGIEGEQTIVRQRLDEARERLRASIAPPPEDAQRRVDETPGEAP
ncbi:MAG: hypothetical protein ACLP8S_01630 [Solirubrobacteraceae bacterium]